MVQHQGSLTINLHKAHLLGAVGFWVLGLASGQAITDANTNGLSDVWEAAYSVLNADPYADPDGDGEQNFRESTAGTDPLNADSVFSLTAVQHLAAVHLVRWESVAGKCYQLEATTNAVGGAWTPVGPVVAGTGMPVLSAVPQASPSFTAFRIHLVTDNTAVSNARPDLNSVDTDLDGLPDLDEWAADTNPFDGNSKLAITSVAMGDAVLLSWHSVIGKRYQIESADMLTSPLWSGEGGEIEGTGLTITAAVEVTGNTRHFRLRVRDEDSDLDSVSDWEETFTGLEFGPWHYRTNFPTDPATVKAMVTATNIINIESSGPIANASRQTSGGFVVTRMGNLNALTVNYTVGGNATPGVHYTPLSGSVVLPPGVQTVNLEVTPLDEAGLDPSRSVVVTLAPGSGYTVGTNAVAQVNVLQEVPFVVTDFGAVGDGVTDDTLAIQTAINALEISSNHNTLHFPAGVYRLNSAVSASSPLTTWHQLLVLGGRELGGRDLVFSGDSDAVLYSTVSWTRAHMLVAHARFRSLSFHGLTWKKHSTALPPISGEPNLAAGVAVMRHDLRPIALVDFLGCRFDNCHPAVDTYFNQGYDTRGLLHDFRMRACTVLNPYGSNTTNATAAFGGGQQVRVSPWVRRAVYADCHFDGAGDDPVDPVKNPGGVRKDGSHFGSPLMLIFTNNSVRRMEVEAVHQIDDTYVGTTISSFVVPPPDGSTPVDVQLSPQIPSTYQPGQLVNVRTWFTSGVPATNVFLRVAGFDAGADRLTLVNEGMTPLVTGQTVPAWQPIYLQDYNPTLATIMDNSVVEGAPRGFIGIASNSKATIMHNYIEGYSTGIYLYENVRNPVNPPTPGTLVKGNVILTSDSSTGYQAYGVESFGPGEIIADNLIVTPRSYRFVGTTVRTTNAWVEGNTVLPITVVRNSYNTFERSVGIGFGNGSSNNTAAANRTYGMDVGIGPENPFQPALHRVISHHSTNDVLAVDPIGLVP